MRFQALGKEEKNYVEIDYSSFWVLQLKSALENDVDEIKFASKSFYEGKDNWF